jgi:O-antigen/teichoic acid export membrane protein
MKPGADWLAWTLQFVFGLLVGAGSGVYFLSRFGRSRDIESPEFMTFIGGAALVGAALASLYGDWLWLGDSYRVIPPQDMQHSDVSKIISVLTGVIGAAAIGIALVGFN